MIALQAVSLRIGRRVLLDGVSFGCEPGGITALLGTNGAGKTLVLRIVATDLRASSGTVRVSGLELPRDATRARQILGYLPEWTPFPPEASVAGYLDVAASGHRLRGRERSDTLDEVLALTELTGLADASVRTLSRGEAQRLEIARTLLHDPDVLLLDEPLAGLDAVGQVEMVEIVRELARLGKTVLVATNFPEWLDDLITTAVLLHEGRVLAIGDAAQLCDPFPDVEVPTWRAALLRHLALLRDNGREQAPSGS